MRPLSLTPFFTPVTPVSANYKAYNKAQILKLFSLDSLLDNNSSFTIIYCSFVCLMLKSIISKSDIATKDGWGKKIMTEPTLIRQELIS